MTDAQDRPADPSDPGPRAKLCRKCNRVKRDVRVSSPFAVPLCNTCWFTMSDHGLPREAG